jgi:hypothetical protein
MKPFLQARWFLAAALLGVSALPIEAQCSKSNPVGIGRMPAPGQFASGFTMPAARTSVPLQNPLAGPTPQQYLQQQQMLMQQQQYMLQMMLLQQRTLQQMSTPLGQTPQPLYNPLATPAPPMQPTPEQLVMMLSQASEPMLKQGLQSTQADIRWAATWVAGNQMRPWHDELIGLLQDSNKMVAAAAHRGLVIEANKDLITKSMKEGKAVPPQQLRDFGPTDGAGADSLASAGRQWREFFAPPTSATPGAASSAKQ